MPIGQLPNGIGQLQSDEKAATAILHHLQKNELQSLLDDDSKLEQLVQDSEMVKHLRQSKQTLLVSNKSLAEYNLSKEENLIFGRNTLAQTYSQAEDLHKKVKESKLQMGCHGNSTSLDILLALLETEAAKTEEQSENLSEQLLTSKIDIGNFTDTYMTMRTQMYQRKVKADKLLEMMHQQPNGFAGR